MIAAYLKGNALLESIKSVKRDSDRFHLWWLGQSGFLIHWQGQYLLLDPYLSDSLTLKYASTEKPHIRMTELVLDPSSLDFIDVVTSSHNHTDHLDADTLKPLMKVNPKMKFIIPEANRDFVTQRLQCDRDYPMGLNEKEKVSTGHFTFHGIPAAHNLLERNSKSQCLYMGYVVEFGPWKIYHSGDTLWYDGMEDILKPFGVDVAILPINGNKPERKVAGNLDVDEAARLGHEIGARMVIPCHYDMFTFNTADPAEFARVAIQMHQPFHILQCGESWNSDLLPD
ncbi:MAG: MBL fold metallo-hydrolase [Bacteroidetes bacterium]|nr:MBL fold metallo-hydrolase [Bacteroidota bacterium]MDA1120494.1 MBL fold metallo-hydrolase [Bacteroidota bacterium]